MGQDNCKPQPGDLIEIDRPLYQHWALYVGDGYVINLTPGVLQPGKDLKLGGHTVPEFIRKVKKQRLKEVVGNHKWSVNNKYDHSYTPLPVKEIIQRAESCNDRELNYRGFGSNCEHFVTNLRYGDEGKTALQNINSISSVAMAGIGVMGLIAAASISVVGLPLVASASFAAAAGGGLLVSIGFTPSNIAHSITSAKFEKVGRDILEKTCC